MLRFLLRRIGWRRRQGTCRRRRNWSLRVAAPVGTAKFAYRAATVSGERLSSLKQEPIRIPAYETAAREGRMAPNRFEWRGQWFQVVDVGAIWSDRRKRTSERPEFGRTYFTVTTASGDHYQIYFCSGEKRKRDGQWMIYKKIVHRHDSRSTAALPNHS